jgi:tRNA threonylcarbamoyladenosine biosynthesis protein TsaB
LVASGAARVGPPDSVVLPAAGVYRGIGRGFAAYPALAGLPGLQLGPRDREALPDAREFAALGARRFAQGEGLDPADLRPLYLRDKVALTEAERGVK